MRCREGASRRGLPLWLALIVAGLSRLGLADGTGEVVIRPDPAQEASINLALGAVDRSGA